MNIFKKYAAKVYRSFKGRGFLNTLKLYPKRFLQGFQYRKFNFNGIIDPNELDGPEELKKHAVKYEASNHVFFRKLFENLNWHYQKSTYVDFGCGKGASLIYASELGFQKIIGVEFSSKLAEIASDNIQKFSDQKGGRTGFEIFNMDASTYEIPTDADCFYFFNPFDGFILDKVMQNIVQSLKTNPRKIIIVYLNALHHQVVEKYGFGTLKYLSVEELDIYFIGGAYVYTNE